MTNVERGHAARGRGELNRTSVGRRLSLAIDARRRLNARRPSSTGNRASHVGPRDRRYEYLTHSHQYDWLGRKIDEINREPRACG
jgi:hypothetical protein